MTKRGPKARSKIGRRFRLFFRYDSKARAIVFAWVDDEQTLRSAGSRSDPYAVFEIQAVQRGLQALQRAVACGLT